MKAGNTGVYHLPYWKLYVMIKITVVKYKTLKNQQKLKAPPMIRELILYLLSVMRLCI